MAKVFVIRPAGQDRPQLVLDLGDAEAVLYGTAGSHGRHPRRDVGVAQVEHITLHVRVPGAGDWLEAKALQCDFLVRSRAAREVDAALHEQLE